MKKRVISSIVSILILIINIYSVYNLFYFRDINVNENVNNETGLVIDVIAGGGVVFLLMIITLIVFLTFGIGIIISVSNIRHTKKHLKVINYINLISFIISFLFLILFFVQNISNM